MLLESTRKKTPEVIPKTRLVFMRMDSTFSIISHYRYCKDDCKVIDTLQVKHAKFFVQGIAEGFPTHAF